MDKVTQKQINKLKKRCNRSEIKIAKLRDELNCLKESVAGIRKDVQDLWRDLRGVF